MLGGCKGLDLARVGKVRTAAEINKITTAVDGGARVARNIGFDDGLLEGVALEELKQFALRDNKTFELLLLLGHFVDLGLDGFVCVVVCCVLLVLSCKSSQHK